MHDLCAIIAKFNCIPMAAHGHFLHHISCILLDIRSAIISYFTWILKESLPLLQSRPHSIYNTSLLPSIHYACYLCVIKIMYGENGLSHNK